MAVINKTYNFYINYNGLNAPVKNNDCPVES